VSLRRGAESGCEFDELESSLLFCWAVFQLSAVLVNLIAIGLVAFWEVWVLLTLDCEFVLFLVMMKVIN